MSHSPYKCAQCGWLYEWTMGDRVKAVKQHQLAHLIEQRNRLERSDLEIAPHLLLEYVDERLKRLNLF